MEGYRAEKFIEYTDGAEPLTKMDTDFMLKTLDHIKVFEDGTLLVVFLDGRPYKKDYKRFKVEGLEDQDDYASMAQVVHRRFVHYQQGDAGFAQAPDLLLIDGGITHAETARRALEALELDFPVFGMVKDGKHRTRALVTPEGREIALDGTPAVFALIGTIQEETHRFAITYHRELRSKRLRYSQLDEIPGVGPKR